MPNHCFVPMKISFQDASCTVFESELMQTTCTLIQRPNHLLLVDPNWLPSEVEAIAEEVARVQAGRPLYLLFTHSDYDHIIAYERFREDASLIVSRALLENPEPDLQLQEIRKFYDQYYLRPPRPITYPQEAALVIAAEKEIHQIGTTSYEFYQAPGHNPDGLITFLPEAGILLAGDYLCSPEFPFIYHSIEAYQTTLQRLAVLLEREELRLLVPGHGPTSTSRVEMQSWLQDAQWYIDQLIAYGRDGEPFPEAALWQRYPYFQSCQMQYHQENLKLAMKTYSAR